MKAVVAQQAGGPEILRLQDLPTPVPAPGQVIVSLAAAGVNFIDTYRRSGIYPVPFPHIIGLEGAGTVAKVGTEVTDLAVGDKVAWASADGSTAEYVAVDAEKTVSVPEILDVDIAAAVMLQGLTAHYLSHSVYPVGPQDTVLIHAGAGGVGLLLTQLCVARGARVLSTVSSAEKAELSRQAGATDTLRYDELADLPTELPALVRSLTDGAGVNVVYDGVGLSTFEASLSSLRPRGTLVLFGGSSGQVPPFDVQRLNSAGSVYLTRPSLNHYTADHSELQWRASSIFDAISTGDLNVNISARYPFADAAQAHRDLESRRTNGKLLLIPPAV